MTCMHSPEGWSPVRVADVAAPVKNAIVGGPFGSDLTAKDYVYDGIPVIRGQNMGSPWITGPYVFVTQEKAASLEANIARPGDLVFTQRGTLGQVSLVPDAPYERYLVSQSQMKITSDDKRVDPKYLYWWFSSSDGQKSIVQSAIQTGVPHINLGILRQLRLTLPTKHEQTAISRSLAEVDALLVSIEKLLAKKRDLKQGAMQQLLTARSRLRSFKGAWQTAKLGALGRFLKGSGVRREEATSGDLPCVRYGELYTQHNNYIRSFGSWISESVARTAAPVRHGDILFAGSGETKQEIGKCAAVVGAQDAYAGGDIVIFRPYEADPLFLGYYLNTPSISVQKASLGQGDAVVHISARALSSIDVCIPSTKEQSAIGQILSEFDAEIDALLERLDKLRALKLGMMQQLLTGRIRLI